MGLGRLFLPPVLAANGANQEILDFLGNLAYLEVNPRGHWNQLKASQYTDEDGQALEIGN